jgi:NAD(P)-dependent dehydrogenase (short-subunit alcohol dehydrogenase family)
MMQASDVKAMITGGASGLGLATAKRLLAAGGRVMLADVNAERGQAVAAELVGANPGGFAQFVMLDVCDEAAAQAAVQAAATAMGGLNTVINCAGVLGAGRVLGKQGAMPLADFSRTVMINLVGSFNIAKAGAQVMSQNTAGDDGERGLIINTASIAAYEGQIGQAAYAASKGGVVGMTLPMARELARFGIRVVTIAPGVFHTPMVDSMPPDVYQSLCAQVPFPSRLGTGEEFADTVLFVLGNRYINGTTIRVDGAVRLQPK